MPDVQPLNDDEREELIAYLDGELSKTEAQSVEKKLGSDPQYKSEADALRRSWSLLDFLPQPEPSGTFTNRTLDRVSAIRPALAVSGQAGWKRWGIRLTWAAAVLLAGVVGYAGVARLPSGARPHDLDAPAELEHQLARDLRLIEQLGLLQHVNDIHFLNELDRLELFGEDLGF
jgi:anti-sigma factor RsiW